MGGDRSLAPLDPPLPASVFFIGEWSSFVHSYQNIRGNTCRGAACILESATPPIPRAELQRFPILGVIVYLYLHPLTQNDQIRHGDTCGERRVFKSARPLHLHTCVARFVRDSWVSCPIRCTTLWGTDEGRLQSIFTTTVKLLQCNIDYKTRYVHPLLKFELNIATEQEFWIFDINYCGISTHFIHNIDQNSEKCQNAIYLPLIILGHNTNCSGCIQVLW